ncbi:MAG TPA: hypothetical protein VER36_07810, partial [Flavisolibacter sp.]|nr:hypothetical protein [Flavisolibacter sp.]
LSLMVLLSCKKEKEEKVQFTLYKATGEIMPKLNEFRNNLGPLNTTPGAVDGRREVNWDGIPDNLLNKPLAKNFFNPVGDGASPSLQRGLVYGDGEFQASANMFAHLNSEAASEFRAFSGNKVFANVSDLEWPVGFEVAGKSAAASVKAFGMVFADVDVENATSLEFFDGEKSLGKFYVPVQDGNSKFSFLAVAFHNRKITKVKVHHQGGLTDGGKDISQGGTTDLIVIDDLIYSEPVMIER